MSSVFTLAFWQLRRTKWLLCIVGLGILAAVVFVCVAPIYAKIATTAGLRSELKASQDNINIVVTADTNRPFLDRVQAAGTAVGGSASSMLNRYLDVQQTRFSVTSDPLSLLTTPSTAGQLKTNGNSLTLNGSEMGPASQHIHLLSGRLPQEINKSHTATDQTIEVVLTPDTAQGLHVQLGSTFYVEMDVTRNYMLLKEVPLPLKVVGLIQSPENTPYWRGMLFNPVQGDKGRADNRVSYYALAANETLISTLSQFVPLEDKPGQNQNIDSSNLITIANPLHVSWFYALNPDKIQGDQLDTLITTLNIFQSASSSNNALSQQYGMTNIHTTVPTTDLSHYYQDQISIAQLPSMGLILVIFLLLLYFVSLMTDLLVERQAGELAVLRSRGASRGQVFGSLLLQGGGLALVALILGPILALPVARLLGHWLLPVQDYPAIELVLQDPWPLILSVGWYALVTVLVVVVVLVFAINHMTSLDVLAIRRESSRSTQRPFWLRMNLDVMVIVLMVAGYLITLYLTNTDVLDAKLRLVLLSPLVLARTVCTILAAILVFLRFFPSLLRFGSWLATQRSRGASSMVALAQLARSPRQSVRMTMLLSLATAFSMFALIFYASQIQRANDVAEHVVGADFKANLASSVTLATLPRTLASYQHLAGVQGASLGSYFSTQIGQQEGAVNLLTVDADTYAQTAAWPANNSSQSLSTLMQQLAAKRADALSKKEIPAIIDQSFFQQYHLKVGDKFSLTDQNNADNPFYFRVMAQVQQIPTQSSPIGVLVDAKSYGRIYNLEINKNGAEPFQLTTIWLRTSDNAADLQTIRSTLQVQTSDMSDRRQMIDTLHKEPLYLQVMGILALGPVVALLLVLIGNLVASWLSARDRLTNFALLRALGASPRNIANTLTWEQSIIYATAIILGVLFGALLSWMVVPSLLFTSAPGQQLSSDEFFFAQNIPPIQIIIPTLLGIGLALLVAVCILALGMMVRIVSSPSMAMTLRLNED
ncbi:ABC transporter permease [Dictyobacter kobayashii]|uniref:ABC3 transporter permease C-terminal domain-containing protein n=1 Tax=Dictyobacter kobayashii TaxID=2014872 RepID=A0A402AH86_9CHLR|nr:ABC transporter permease [Dictyobacter kobayashii]GCE18470.1 hypothetical protein KDK_22700 [Dictyobacter kobayashii]